MTDQLKKQSGYDVVKILVNKFGFIPRKTKSDHIVLIRFVNNEK